MAGAEHGGAETACIDMCELMARNNIDVRIATRPNETRVSRLDNAGITTYELPFGGKADMFTPWRLAQICKSYRPHIVQTWLSRAAQKAAPWKASMKIPRYLICSRLGGYYKLSHFPNTDYFTTITPDIRRHLIEAGVSPDKVKHINNFAETEECVQPANRNDLDTPEEATVLIALGRLHQAKAFDTLMKAVKDLPDVYVWIAGEGPLRGELENLRAELGLQERVKLLGWREDRAALLQAADICVFPSRYEPFGTVFVQAWAQKTPLITSNADGPRQFVRNNEDGLIFDIDDVGMLTNAIKTLISDPSLKQRLGEKGHDRYLHEFTAKNTLKAYLDFYSDILEREGIEY